MGNAFSCCVPTCARRSVSAGSPRVEKDYVAVVNRKQEVRKVKNKDLYIKEEAIITVSNN